MTKQGLNIVNITQIGKHVLLYLTLISVAMNLIGAETIAIYNVIMSTKESERSPLENSESSRVISVLRTGIVVVREGIKVSGSTKAEVEDKISTTTYRVSSESTAAVLRRIERQVSLIGESEHRTANSGTSVVIEVDYGNTGNLWAWGGMINDMEGEVKKLREIIMEGLEKLADEAWKVETEVEVVRSAGDTVAPTVFDWAHWEMDPHMFYGSRVEIRGYLLNDFEELSLYQDRRDAEANAYDRRIEVGSVSSFSEISPIYRSDIKGDVKIVGVLLEGVGNGFLTRITEVVPLQRNSGNEKSGNQ